MTMATANKRFANIAESSKLLNNALNSLERDLSVADRDIATKQYDQLGNDVYRARYSLKSAYNEADDIDEITREALGRPKRARNMLKIEPNYGFTPRGEPVKNYGMHVPLTTPIKFAPTISKEITKAVAAATGSTPSTVFKAMAKPPEVKPEHTGIPGATAESTPDIPPSSPKGKKPRAERKAEISTKAAKESYAEYADSLPAEYRKYTTQEAARAANPDLGNITLTKEGFITGRQSKAIEQIKKLIQKDTPADASDLEALAKAAATEPTEAAVGDATAAAIIPAVQAVEPSTAPAQPTTQTVADAAAAATTTAQPTAADTTQQTTDQVTPAADQATPANIAAVVADATAAAPAATPAAE